MAGTLLFRLALALGGSTTTTAATMETTSGHRPEVLYNGIELPAVWPPRINLTNHTTLARPWYVTARPAAVVVDVGRQLFVDDFLLRGSGATNATVTFHAPKLAPTTAGTILGGGGMWWDSQEGHFKNFYTCDFVHIGGDGGLGPLCLAISSDGVHWQNESNGQPVWNVSAYSRAVLLDETDPSSRWKMAAVEGGTYNPISKTGGLAYQLYTSPDGRHWSRAAANRSAHVGIGSPGDCSSAIINPFRRKWVLSSKMYPPLLGRSRMYAEASDWCEEALGAAPTVPWSAADVLDPRYLGQHQWSKPCVQCETMPQCVHGAARCSNDLGLAPEEYNLDAVAYESVMLGMFRIFRCKVHYKGCTMMTTPNGTVISHELADMLLGWSRDGFTFSRTPVAQPVGAIGFELTADRRYPFVGQALGNSSSWNRHGIGSVVGGLTITGPDKQHESLRLFFSSATAGVATLRRDGFASIGSGAQPSRLLTTMLVFHTNKTCLFLNVRGGVRNLVILDSFDDDTSENGRQRPPLLRMGSEIPDSSDSTMLEVKMGAGTIPSVASLRGKPFCLSFELNAGTRLYSFWFSTSSRGHSDGWLGAGGPSYPKGLRDVEEFSSQ